MRFWTQLNATPLHGAKDVHAVALFSDAGGNAQLLQAEDWLEQVGKEYSVSTPPPKKKIKNKINKNLLYRC